jgi:serine/threonine protein phosphatase PrpC
VGAATGVRAEEEVLFGMRSVGGVTPGFFKENQDDAFVARKNFALNSPGSHKDFFAAVMDGHGLAGKHVSGFIKSQLTQDVRTQRRGCRHAATTESQSGHSYRQAVSSG